MPEQKVPSPGGGLEGKKPRRRGLSDRTRATLAQRTARRATGGKVPRDIAGLLPRELRDPVPSAPATATAGATGAAAGTAKAARTVPPSLLRRLGPVAGLLLPFVGIEGLRRTSELRQQGEDIRGDLATLRDPNERAAIIEDRLLKERLQENIIAAKLARMQNVARNDPALFKMLSAMVAGSKRPRTTPQTIRIGPEPSQLDMLSSGLF